MANVEDLEVVFHTSAEELGPDDLLVRRFDGVEAMSTPYEYEIELECRVEGGLPPDLLDELIDNDARLAFGPHARYGVSGILRRVELVDVSADAGRSQYRVTLVPRMWQLKLIRRSRVFTDQSIADILQAVLGGIGLVAGDDFELRLRGTYEPREYVVQYEETDFDFISRWMERLGIFYFFEQSDERDRIVLCDRNEELVKLPVHERVEYAHHASVALPGAAHALRMVQQTIPAEVRVRDYNWRAPHDFVTGRADADPEHGRGMFGHYGDHLRDGGEAERIARARAEEWKAVRVVFTAESAAYDMVPGFRTSLVGAPIGDYDQEYVLTRVVHRFAQDALAAGGGSYTNAFEMIPYATAYRAPRRTPWPRIEGVMHAKIDAEAISTAAAIDGQGRYKVVLPCDMFGAYGGRATRWIRKAEGYAGPEYGMHFPLHPGVEVLLAHIDGDPDRPIIIGAVPNPMTATVVDSRLSTRSAIRTHAGILFDFEDDAQP